MATGEAVNNPKARMPPSAVQLPIRQSPATSLGSRVFRKQLLPVGRVPYRGRSLDFTGDYLRKLAQNFKAGAFDQVPFVLADPDNKHNMEPDRFRGEVKGFEFTGDGLDFIVEMTDDGAELLRKNPKLGVSARIVEEGRDFETPRAVPAIQHVCGTLDPVATRLRDWEPVSDLATSYSAEQVIDLTAETYEQMPGTDADTKLTDEQREALKGLNVPDDQMDAVAAVFAKSGDGEGKEAGTVAANAVTADKIKANAVTTGDADKPKWTRKILAALTGRSEDDFSDEKIAALTETGEPAKPKEGEPAEVALTAEAQRAVDLAASDSAAAKRDAAEARAALREQEFKTLKAELTAEGVPPASIDLAADLLKAPDSAVIELSSGEKASPREAVIKLLKEQAGTIDLTGPLGTAVTDDDPERAEAKELAEKMGEAG